MGGPDFVRSAVQRQEGYLRALVALGIPANPAFCVGNVYQESNLYGITQALMGGPRTQRPTAFFAWNDVAAMHVLRALQDLGVRVPEEASLIGFDDSPMVATFTPPLTTVRQPYREIGEHAVQLLLDRIRGVSPASHQQLLPATLIERNSVAAPQDE